MSDRIKELEAKLAEVTAERDELKRAGQEYIDVLKARAEAAEARLVEVTAERDALHEKAGFWEGAAIAKTEYIAAAEAANLRFYRAGIEAAKQMVLGSTLIVAPESVGQREGAESVRQQLAQSVHALPDPTDEQMDAIRKGGK
jgi:hypothetical protein